MVIFLCNLRQRGHYVQSNYLEVMTDRNEERSQWKQRHLSYGWIFGNTFSINMTRDNNLNKEYISGWILSQSLPTHNKYDLWWKERYQKWIPCIQLRNVLAEKTYMKMKYRKHRLNRKQLDESQKTQSILFIKASKKMTEVQNSGAKASERKLSTPSSYFEVIFIV